MSKGSSIQVVTASTSPSHHARIGPNAIIQTIQALKESYGDVQAAAMLRHAGQAHLIDYVPTGMVDEAEFYALVTLLTDQLGLAGAQQVLRRSGQLTAHYLLQHRIPRPFQQLVRMLPRCIGLALLLVAIRNHAWTFVGSGTFQFTLGRPPKLTIMTGQYASEAAYSFYGGTFETLLRALIDRNTRLEAAACQGPDATAQVYAVLSG